jgi:hypothetical protein
MSIGSIVSRVLPVAVGYVTGGPVGAFTSTIATAEAKKQERQVKRQVDQYNKAIQQAQEQEMIGLDAFGGSGPTIRTTPPPPQPSFFTRLGNIGSQVGDTLLTGLESAVPSLLNRAIFGRERPQSAQQQPSVTTTTNVGAQESQGSGSIQAGAGTILPQILGQARNLLKSPAGQIAIGTGTGFAFSGMSSQPSSMRITRKMKSQARMVLNMTGGNLGATADILGIDQNMLVMILLKRFRNDGPVVTKAALRKTKQTIRRLHNMQDVLKSITPTTTGRRRAPIKRATTTTLIKN